MTGPLRIDRYDWPGGSETMLRVGPDDGPLVIAAPALFEEANRTRGALVDVLRRLAAAGIGSALPDMPGTGESLIATADARLADWRSAFAAAAATLDRPHVVAWRGGALLDTSAKVASRWYLSPLDGADVVRDLRRIRQAAGGEDYAGNTIAAAMIADLEVAESRPDARAVRLVTDPRPADHVVSGRPLWRGSEPATDDTLQEEIAADIIAWITSCAS